MVSVVYPVQPFLKWPGGKQWLAPRLAKLVSATSGTYFEPFLGGGSLFFASCPQAAVLSDTNAELIETFQVVKKDAEAIISVLCTFSFTKKCYYRVRASVPRSRVTRAARFIYLNHTCWNGLYRVNRQGRFNVPLGKFGQRPDFIGRERLRLASKALAKAKVLQCDFEAIARDVKAGDFVYLDPPYTVAHTNNGFLRYNERIYSWDDQKRLARLARTLANRGAFVIATNAAHSSIAGLYCDFVQHEVERLSLISAAAKNRRRVKELLISSAPLPPEIFV
jgi:DNA adenine methylase